MVLAAAPVILLLLPAGDVRKPATQDVIDGVREAQRTLGIEATRNFSRHDSGRTAFYRCYYTEKLTLPDSYEGLRMEKGGESGCNLDPAKYDVFFYRMEAVASGDVPVTTSLAEASTERAAMVVSHEDFHDQARKLPEPVAEAATTLVGFLTAAEFARSREGESSALYRNLSREADLYLEKARLVNEYHELARELYRRRRAGTVGETEALAFKTRLFGELEMACKAIHPEPRSFNRCLGANNNAGLAFDATYTRFYPLLYEVYTSLGRNAKALVAAIDKASSERDATAYLRSLAVAARKGSE